MPASRFPDPLSWLQAGRKDGPGPTARPAWNPDAEPVAEPAQIAKHCPGRPPLRPDPFLRRVMRRFRKSPSRIAWTDVTDKGIGRATDSASSVPVSALRALHATHLLPLPTACTWTSGWFRHHRLSKGRQRVSDQGARPQGRVLLPHALCFSASVIGSGANRLQRFRRQTIWLAPVPAELAGLITVKVSPSSVMGRLCSIPSQFGKVLLSTLKARILLLSSVV